MRRGLSQRFVGLALAGALALPTAFGAVAPAVALAEESNPVEGTETPAATTPLMVTFFATEAEVEGSMSDQVDWSGTAVTLAPCAFTRAGHRFVGWQATTSSGTVTYEDGATIPASDFGAKGLLQLVALWEPNTYTLAFDLAGGTMEISSLECTYGEYVTYPVPTRPGYSFTGWQLASGVLLESGNRALLSTFNGDTVTLTATWEAADATIAFNPNYPGGTAGPALDGITAHNGSNRVSLPALELEGYDFVGWDNGSGPVLVPGSHAMAEAFGSPSTDVATLVGVWKPHTYTVVFDYAGGTVRENGLDLAASAPTSFEYGSTLTLPSPKREGYTLAGWFDEAGNAYGKDAAISNLVSANGGSTRLTALWHKVSASGNITPQSQGGNAGTIAPKSMDELAPQDPSAEKKETGADQKDDSAGSAKKDEQVQVPAGGTESEKTAQGEAAATSATEAAATSATEATTAAAPAAPTTSTGSTTPAQTPSEARVVEIADDDTATGAGTPTTSVARTSPSAFHIVLIIVGCSVTLLLLAALGAWAHVRRKRAAAAKDADGRHYGGSDDS